jgi:hypothetical protein
LEPEINPVATPSAYQSLLLGLLGADDPAEAQRGTADVLRDLVRDAGPLLRARPAPGEWSVLELIGHLLDGELMAAGRYRWILAHDTPPIMPYDQDLFATRLRHNEADPEELIRPFEALADASLALWARIPEHERARYGVHQERGPESYDLTFRLMAGHNRLHIAQARDTLAALRGSQEVN